MCMQFLYNQVARLRASSFHTGQKCLIAIFPTALEGVHTCKPVGFSHSTLPRTDSNKTLRIQVPLFKQTVYAFYRDIKSVCRTEQSFSICLVSVQQAETKLYCAPTDLNTMVCLYGQVTEFVSRPTIFLSILILLITTTKENSYSELLAKRFTTLYILCSFITLITAVYMHMNSNKMFNKKIHFCLSDKYLQHIQTNTNML